MQQSEPEEVCWQSNGANRGMHSLTLCFVVSTSGEGADGREEETAASAEKETEVRAIGYLLVRSHQVSVCCAVVSHNARQEIDLFVFFLKEPAPSDPIDKAVSELSDKTNQMDLDELSQASSLASSQASDLSEARPRRRGKRTKKGAVKLALTP